MSQVSITATTGFASSRCYTLEKQEERQGRAKTIPAAPRGVLRKPQTCTGDYLDLHKHPAKSRDP